ncbi:MAG: hypothetical protein ACJAVA_000183 [Flavobacteriaceae bacterium]|jgi:hypothetical protein
MKTDKFKEIFEHCQQQFGGQNDRVVIVTDNPSVGGRYRIPVNCVSSGFDWEQGDIIIEVDEKIFSQKMCGLSNLSKFIYSINTDTWDKIRKSESDAECRRLLKEKI